MILSYLILSQEYYGDMSMSINNQLSNKLTDLYNLKKHTKINFAAFRYDNKQALFVNEYFNLFQFLHICSLNNTIPIINISSFKIETLLFLYLHGFYTGVHFKEREMDLLYDDICVDLRYMLDSIQKNELHINADNNVLSRLESLYNILGTHKEQTKNICNIISKLLDDRDLLKIIYNPLQHALIIYKQMNHLGVDSNFTKINKQNIDYPPIFFSAHNMNDIERALLLGVDYVTISPIFYDKFNKALGKEFIANIPNQLKPHIFALGGIDSDEKIELLKEYDIVGFAAIKYFLP